MAVSKIKIDDVKTGSITCSSGVTDIDSFIKKRAGITTISVHVGLDSVLSGRTLIATFPMEFAPTGVIRVLCNAGTTAGGLINRTASGFIRNNNIYVGDYVSGSDIKDVAFVITYCA